MFNKHRKHRVIEMEPKDYDEFVDRINGKLTPERKRELEAKGKAMFIKVRKLQEERTNDQ
ncbi:hypothetical protein [Lacticaseibacillus sharpeae]|uniref:Uncharacterized protein n=1 Tax=Lacticaseibacillus sharpeae JCM 1186 = DSM 20505 TaxID=1291052 RepID=A0A0R1ZVP8_9LACO|nr:hypothetical protein [Lacticaseibacillus sharpeae]KRM55865.1 hypothetical protein FC18_GL000915 [Lacticaseibacillus sharpeae JCM 1186 = DSM 20505]